MFGGDAFRHFGICGWENCSKSREKHNAHSSFCRWVAHSDSSQELCSGTCQVLKDKWIIRDNATEANLLSGLTKDLTELWCFCRLASLVTGLFGRTVFAGNMDKLDQGVSPEELPRSVRGASMGPLCPPIHIASLSRYVLSSTWAPPLASLWSVGLSRAGCWMSYSLFRAFSLFFQPLIQYLVP